MHADSLLPMHDTYVWDESLGTICAPSSEPFHPLYRDLFHESTILMISTNHSELYPTSVGCRDVNEGDVSQLHYENIESLIPDLFHLQSLTCEEENLTSQSSQDGSLIASSLLSIQEEPYVPHTQPDQTSGFNDCHYIENIFTRTFDDYHSYPSVDPTNPPESYDPPSEDSGTHEEVEELQLPLMVMLGSHDPDETSKPS